MGKTEWQDQPEQTLTIPAHHFVCGVELDADEPYIRCCPHDGAGGGSEITVGVPLPLAYYLTTHSCGSDKVAERLREGGRREIRNKIKEALGISQ